MAWTDDVATRTAVYRLVVSALALAEVTPALERRMGAEWRGWARLAALSAHLPPLPDAGAVGRIVYLVDRVLQEEPEAWALFAPARAAWQGLQPERMGFDPGAINALPNPPETVGDVSLPPGVKAPPPAPPSRDAGWAKVAGWVRAALQDPRAVARNVPALSALADVVRSRWPRQTDGPWVEEGGADDNG
jgi:hypothetical protein